MTSENSNKRNETKVNFLFIHSLIYSLIYLSIYLYIPCLALPCLALPSLLDYLFDLLG